MPQLWQWRVSWPVVNEEKISSFWCYNPGQKLWPKLRKTALSLTPQAMYNQFKRPSAGSVSELYYICRKT